MARRKLPRPLLGVMSVAAALLAIAAVLLVSGKLPGFDQQDALAATDSTGTAPVDSAVAAAEEDPAVPVEVAAVAPRSIAAFYRAASVVEADRLVDLTARVEGRVRHLGCEEGDWVERGQLLAELENDRQKVRLRQAELKVEDQERQLARSREMLAEELISQQEFDDVQSAYEQAAAERDLAAIELEETRLCAPFAGQVTERLVVEGQHVAPGAAAFTLADFTPLRVSLHLPESVASKVSAGQTVRVYPEATDDVLVATVERVCPVVDPATSTVRITLRLPDGAASARVGGFVKVRVVTDRHHDALAVPKLALVEEGSLRSVFVAEADTVRKVEVATGLHDDSHIEILEGLEAGWAVVTLGQGGLRTGSRIEILHQPAADLTVARDE